jgi:hypothetical protein
MKKINLTLITSIICLSAFSQGGTATNFNFGGNFLGFNAGVNGPLPIRNNFNNQIRLFTNNSERLRVFQFNISPSCPTGG